MNDIREVSSDAVTTDGVLVVSGGARMVEGGDCEEQYVLEQMLGGELALKPKEASEAVLGNGPVPRGTLEVVMERKR